MTPVPPIDRLSALLERFRVRARLSFTGALCGLQQFDARSGVGHLHVLRRGMLDVTHPARSDLPARLHLDQPSLLFYPRAVTHRFHNPPEESTDFTCAEIEFEGGALNPLARALPDLIVLPLAQIDGLEGALTLLFAETDHVRCGQRLLADRLFEVVLIQLLRWLLDNPRQAGVPAGLITGLSEPRLARALVALHEQPGAAWSLERMADVAGMSRTSFATTFKGVIGQTPADYLADWRLALMQNKLRQGVPIKLLADELGYANASALTRVFTARTGLSPRAWLKSRDSSAS